MDWGLLAQRVLDGLANGSLYGSLALAISVVYRAGGRVNLAQGELATLGTYASLVLSTPASAALAGTTLAAQWLPGAPWPQWFAIPAAMVASAALAALLERLVLRRIPERDVRGSLSVTVALLLLLNAATSQWFGGSGRSYRSPFPDGVRDRLSFGGVRLRFTTIGTWATLLVVLGLLVLVSRRTRLGLAFRAVASDRTASALCGVRAGRVLSASWAVAAALGTLVGCLAASRLVLAPSMMTRLLVYALVAASIGGLASPGGALLGGAVVGAGQSLIGGYVPGIGNVFAFPVVVGLMIVVLAVRPGGIAGGGGPRLRADDGVAAVVAPPPPEGPARWVLTRSDPRWRALVALGVAAAVVMAVVPAFVFPYVEARLATEVVATAMALWGLGFLVGDAGRISLAHATFMGVGAYTTAVAADRWGLHPFLGVAVAAVVGFVLGGLLGLPALRIRGQHLAMVTFALAVIFPAVLNRFSWLTGGELGPPPTDVPRLPGWLSWLPIPADRTFAWLHLVSVVVAIVVGVMLRNVRASAFGRAVRASAEHEAAAAAMGVPVTRVRTLTFAIGTALAAAGGAFVAVQTQAVTIARFDVMRSLALYALIAVFGAGSLTGAVLAAVAFVGTPWALLRFDVALGARGVPPDAPGGGAFLVWGAALVVIAVAVPEGLVPWARRRAGRVVRVVEREHAGRYVEPVAPRPPGSGPWGRRRGRDGSGVAQPSEPGLAVLDADAPLGPLP